MVIGDRLLALRKQKELSQGDIQKRTGLLRCYISRVENGHTVPSVDTLEKMARALEVPLYQLFYDGDKPLNLPKLSKPKSEVGEWGDLGKDRKTLDKFRKLLNRTDDKGLKLLMFLAQKMADSNRAKP
jgi:transcriptional regulator with XRE-family HTH domain